MEYRIDHRTFENWKKTFSDIFSEEIIKGNEQDLSEFLCFLASEKIAPYYYFKCKDRIENDIVKTKLRNLYFHFLGANEILRKKSEFVIKRLNDLGIVPLVLKGIDLQDNLYPKPELRPTSDLDLLVFSKEDFDKSLQEILNLGYRIYEYRSLKFPLVFGKDLVLLPPDSKGIMIELHHSLRFGKYDKRKKYDEVFYNNKNMIRHNSGNIEYYGFSKEANYVYLCHHALKSHIDLNRVIWILDLFVLKENLNKEKVLEIANQSNSVDTVEFSFELMDALISNNKEKRAFFSKEKDKNNCAFLKLFNEFKNINGLTRKIYWLFLWFAPEKVFLKKRYGEKATIYLYFIYYKRLFERLTQALWGVSRAK